MVKGIDLFRERLGAFSDTYVVIGGTACDLAMAESGGFRATKDIDMIVVTENVDAAFAEALRSYEPIPLPSTIRDRMEEFADRMAVSNPEWADILAAVGTTAISPDVYIERYRRLFGI